MSLRTGQATGSGLDASGTEHSRFSADSDLERRFRAVQISAVQKYTTIMMLGNVVNAGLFLWVASQAGRMTFAVPWAVLILLYSATAIRSWHRARKRDPAKGASRRAVRHAVRNSFVLGSAWGLVAMVLYPAAPAQGQTVVAVITGGMIYGGGFALSAIPAAMNAYLAPLVLAGVVALVLDLQPTDLVLSIPLLVFSFIIQRAGVGHGRLLRANFEDRERLAEQSKVIALLLHDFERGTSDWLWQVDADGHLQRGATRTADAIRVTVDELRDRDVRDLIADCCDDPKCHAALLRRHLARGTPFRDVEVLFARPLGRSWLRLSGHPLHDVAGGLIGFRGVASDISAQKAAELHISYLARHDALTGLLNRSSFGEELETFFDAHHLSGDDLGLLYLDLDGFKGINDRRGHISGDRLLVDVAHRIADVTGGDGVVARIGGDEFAVLLRNVGRTRVLDLASRLIKAIGEPLVLDGDPQRIGVSIGIAFAGPDANDAESLVSAADIALYRAKESSKNTSRVFDAEMRATARRHEELQQDLHFAIERNELELHYQPIVLAESGAIQGFEALLRWRHPVRGVLPPGEFVHIAETGGTIHEIGRWVMREACRAATAWPPHVFVSINLSPEQLRSPDLVSDIEGAILSSGLDPARLETELTEGVLVEDAEDVAGKLSALKDLGVSVALDDFGTGYSSFGYLTTFGFDRLKIDRSLVARCDADERARNVLEAIMVMSRALGLQTTAEGVENDRHASVLRGVGCDLLQGYFFARPMTPDELREWHEPDLKKGVSG